MKSLRFTNQQGISCQISIKCRIFRLSRILNTYEAHYGLQI